METWKNRSLYQSSCCLHDPTTKRRDKYHTSHTHLTRRTFATTDKPTTTKPDNNNNDDDDVDFPGLRPLEPLVCPDVVRREVAADLFHQYAQVRDDGVASLDVNDVGNLLREIGEIATPENIQRLFAVADADSNGVIDREEFLEHYDYILGGNPARIILVVGGPGSGKGVLSERLQQRCGVVHLSSGDLLRTEVARGSALGRQVRDIMARGELVSSAIMVALMKRRLRDHPGKRVLLDGFPRSLENAHDLVALCGKPELALHLVGTRIDCRHCRGNGFGYSAIFLLGKHSSLCFCLFSRCQSFHSTLRLTRHRIATTPSCWNASLVEVQLLRANCGKMIISKRQSDD